MVFWGKRARIFFFFFGKIIWQYASHWSILSNASLKQMTRPTGDLFDDETWKMKKKKCKQTSIWRIFQKYKKPIYCHWKIKLIIQYLLEYRLLGLEWTGSPYTAGMPHSLDDDILCAVSTDISGGGMGFILPLSENLKIKIKIKLVYTILVGLLKKKYGFCFFNFH